MANCRKAAEYLAGALVSCEKLKFGNLELPRQHPESGKIGELEEEVLNLEEYLKGFYEKIGRESFFDAHAHDIANLKNKYITKENVYRYAADLQQSIISEGILDLIDCQCPCAKTESFTGRK